MAARQSKIGTPGVFPTCIRARRFLLVRCFFATIFHRAWTVGRGIADDVNLLRIIERIYDAATDPSTLGALAPEIAHEFACDTSWLYVVQNPKAKSTDLLLSATANFDDLAHSSYTNYYRQRDVWGGEAIKAGLATTHPIVIHGQEILDPNKLTRS